MISVFFEKNVSLNELSGFFCKLANPAGGLDAPVLFNYPEVEFGRLLGFTTQAGKLNSIVSLKK